MLAKLGQAAQNQKMKLTRETILTCGSLLFFCQISSAWAGGGSVHNHLTFDIMPLSSTPNAPIGSGFGFSYDRYHDELKSSYTLSTEASFPFHADGNRIDLNVNAGLFTSITPAFSLGAKIGYITNALQDTGFGAIALRLPALNPEDKDFFSFFYEEIDLGMSGSGSRYANIRFAMTLF